MTLHTRPLAQLQSWMQTVVTHHGGIAAGIASAAARQQVDINVAELSRVILPGPAQSSLERLTVYGNAYYARLLHCLQELFPACRAAVGEEIFDEFAFGYLQAHPPTSYTLGNLANQFVDFLDRTRSEYFGEEPPPDWASFLVELARLELAIDDVFDGPGIEGLSAGIAETIAAIPCDAWGELQLAPAPSLRLLAFEFPVNAYFTAFRRGESPDLPGPQASYLLLTRLNFVVRRHELDRTQYQLLSALVAGGPIAGAIQQVFSNVPEPAQVAGRLSEWFGNWTREGCFQGVQTVLPATTLLQTEIRDGETTDQGR